MVDGSVEDVFRANMEDKGRLGVVVRNMLDNSVKSGIIISPSLQQYNAVQLDLRGSPSIPTFIVKEKEIKIKGLALLNQDGKYVTSLNLHESSLTLILQDFLLEQIPITLQISSNQIEAPKKLRQLSIGIKKRKRKINTSYKNGHFTFDFQLDLSADLVERMFPLDASNHPHLLTSIIEQQLNQDIARLITKTQKHQVDPFGFGVFARAKQYEQWRKVRSDWFQAYGKADINVSTHLTLLNTGVSH
jgi:hypothetical protein